MMKKLGKAKAKLRDIANALKKENLFALQRHPETLN
jgi:hypothetical protein